MEGIKQVWFDFSDTIGRIDREIYNEILYSAYAKAVGKEVTEELKKEYAEAFKKYKSNSGVFSALGLPAGHLADCISVVDPNKLYTLTDEDIPAVLQELKDIVPISIFSNNKLNVILPALGVDIKWFTHVLGPDDVKKPKPDLEGFHKIVETSKSKAEELLYVGDDLDKDLKPAKEVGILTALMWKDSDEADYSFMSFKDLLNMFKHE